jgi:putative pyruvate formate lyase activating enzyme
MRSGIRGPLAKLKAQAVAARRHLRRCTLCPRACGVDRAAGERGFCGAGATVRVAACSVHGGEEPPISGTRGSGNVFFTGCNLACIFCQNYPISRLGVGRDLRVEELAAEMRSLEAQGAHNINCVTPTPWVPQILEALLLARDAGLAVPVVWNCGGYEALPTLRLLEGAVEIFLPDMKYVSGSLAWSWSRAPRYPAVNRAAVAEMVRQAGPLRVDRAGIARRGVLVRHLVLPARGGETAAVLKAVRSISPRLPVSLMFQYFPAHRAVGHPVLGRRLWREECVAARRALGRAGITAGWRQGYD